MEEMSMETPAMAQDDMAAPEREQAQMFMVPVDPIKVNGIAPSDGDMCKFEVMGMAKGSAVNGFIPIEPKSINGMDVPNPVSEDNTGTPEGSGPESNDDNDDLASARSQYNEQAMSGY